MLVQEQHGIGAFVTYLNSLRGPECRVDETQPSAETGYTSSKTTFQRGPAKWYVYDGLGSVVGEVDPSGNLTSSPKYDVYGMVRSNAGTASSKMGFVGGLGHVSDTETGLIYMRARYYDPTLGRFESEDPSEKGLNWFVYCNNNSVNMVDASGRAGEAWIEAAAKLLWNANANANGIDLGFDPTDDLVSNLEKLRAVIDGAKAKANRDIIAGTIEAYSPEVVADDSGVIAADGSNRAKTGLVEKATGAITEEQINLIEAWVDYVK